MALPTHGSQAGASARPAGTASTAPSAGPTGKQQQLLLTRCTDTALMRLNAAKARSHSAISSGLEPAGSRSTLVPISMMGLLPVGRAGMSSEQQSSGCTKHELLFRATETRPQSKCGSQTNPCTLRESRASRQHTAHNQSLQDQASNCSSPISSRTLPRMDPEASSKSTSSTTSARCCCTTLRGWGWRGKGMHAARGQDGSAAQHSACDASRQGFGHSCCTRRGS